MAVPTQLTFGTFLAPNLFAVHAAVARHLGGRLGVPARCVTGSSYEQFARGELDVGFICGLPYVQLRRETPPPVELLAAPVLVGDRYQGRPIYFSDVIVRGDSRFRTFADLRGASWAYNEPQSHSGYLRPLYQLAQMGETPAFFGEVVEAGWHEESIRKVCRAEVDAAAIDSGVLAVEMARQPALGTQLRVIATLGPSTIQPVVAARHLDPATIARLREELPAMTRFPEIRRHLDGGLMAEFAPIQDGAYDDIRGLLAAVEARGLRMVGRDARRERALVH
jgi:phosphonate transport system substrate-binding protein